ncbi:antigen [Methanosarcina lacustris Z-7289]|uniref:Antigen n=1 Tax=Methanosarcina lacustris Z-7289 TaxID=1434111 RepID=A0A0E3WS12_9EURY|nr:PRC-barrel domain-containing protein [Methanosarcina lacustris]AKB75495.1 antigen [Methanosarcina lacustris Z-7289]
MGIVEETQVSQNITFVPATVIKGSKVLTVKDEELGMIKEVMIDSEKGRIAYIVLACECFLGMKCKFFAVPWGALQASRGDYILKVDKGAFEAAEGLEGDVWTLNRNDLAKVYEQYKLPPYWVI